MDEERYIGDEESDVHADEHFPEDGPGIALNFDCKFRGAIGRRIGGIGFSESGIIIIEGIFCGEGIYLPADDGFTIFQRRCGSIVEGRTFVYNDFDLIGIVQSVFDTDA